MNIDYDAIHAEARRLRRDAMRRYVHAPIAALVQRLLHAEPRKPAAVFPVSRGC